MDRGPETVGFRKMTGFVRRNAGELLRFGVFWTFGDEPLPTYSGD